MITKFQSKTPFTYYFLLAFLTFTIVLFSVFAIIDRLDVISSIFCILLSNLVIFYLFGRYLCRLTLYEDKIQLTYLYPFKINKGYVFKGISELDFRGASLQNIKGVLVPELDLAINRGFYRIYLTDQKGRLFDIKYNISAGDNDKLMKILIQQIK